MWTRTGFETCAETTHPLGVRFVKTQLLWDGKPARTYWYVEQPAEGIYIAALDDECRVLLVEHYRAPFDTYFWEVPAGGVRPTETIRDAARRELLEETGASMQSIRVLLEFAPSPGLTTTRARVLLGRGARIVRQRHPNPEIRQVELLPIDAAIARLQAAPLASGGSLLALLLARWTQS